MDIPYIPYIYIYIYIHIYIYIYIYIHISDPGPKAPRLKKASFFVHMYIYIYIYILINCPAGSDHWRLERAARLFLRSRCLLDACRTPLGRLLCLLNASWTALGPSWTPSKPFPSASCTPSGLQLPPKCSPSGLQAPLGLHLALPTGLLERS